LTRTDAATEAMLTNREVLAVDQSSTENQARLHTATTWVWTARAKLEKGEYIALFNVGDAPLDMRYTWQALGLSPGKHAARDLWLHKNLGKTPGIKVRLAPHASALYRVE
ncbi:MAG TPA: glycoside hydrolase family 27 protein, partial [Acidobacteriaceae bacterium]|nr:glycoside hydrolase family 27 protein [Acidobacteriaceae bacterium]